MWCYAIATDLGGWRDSGLSKSGLIHLVGMSRYNSLQLGACLHLNWGFPCGAVLKNPLASAEDAREAGLIPGLGRTPGVENANPLQHSSLGNSMDRGAWWATVHGVTEESGTTEET